jgi:hypothetical protein
MRPPTATSGLTCLRRVCGTLGGQMSSLFSLLPLYVAIAVAGVYVIAAVIFVQAVVRISQSFARIATSLDEMALTMRRRDMR